MKIFLSTILICLVLVAQGCKKDDDLQDPIDRLPEATQTGAQTMGCLIDGEVWIPTNFGTGRANAFYQFVDGAYTLGISGSSGGGTEMRSIRFGCLDVIEIIEEGGMYDLKEFNPGNYVGEYSAFNAQDGTATADNPGTLTITRFDDSIISGTFEFTVLDNDGNEIHITDGRFDLNYTN